MGTAHPNPSLAPSPAARKEAWCPAGCRVRPCGKISRKKVREGYLLNMFGGRGAEQLPPVLTLMACPKKPFPRTSPWIRSHGRKICWE